MPSDDLLLRELAGRKFPRLEIARRMDRTPLSIQWRAKRLGISLDPRKWVRPDRDPDVSTWTQADRIAAWADVPQDLAEIVVSTCNDLGQQVKEVRSNSRKGDLVGCRQEIARRAKAARFSYPLIGRAINRDHTSVIHLVRTNPSPQYTSSKVADRNPSDAYTARWNRARTSAAG